MLEAFVDKMYFFKWGFSEPLLQGKENTNKEGEIPCARDKHDAWVTYQAY